MGKKRGDKAFWTSVNFPRRGWNQRFADFNRFLQKKHGNWCYLLLYLHVFICDFLWGNVFLSSSCLLASLLLRDTFLPSHIYFHLDDCEICKQYQFVSQETMEQICDLETVEPQEIPIKVSVIFYNAEIC